VCAAVQQLPDMPFVAGRTSIPFLLLCHASLLLLPLFAVFCRPWAPGQGVSTRAVPGGGQGQDVPCRGLQEDLAGAAACYRVIVL
jgi:hypothetical protein